MWTIEARESMLQSIFDQIKDGAKLVFFVNDHQLLTVELKVPVASIQNGAIIFNAAEDVSTQSGTPTHAILTAKGTDLLNLPIPDVLSLIPRDVIAGSVIKVERFIIQ